MEITRQTVSPLPAKIAKLDDFWIRLYKSLPELCSYERLSAEFGFKNAKVLSNILSIDPDAPRRINVGRNALIPRESAILWAWNRAKNAKRRGRRPASPAE